MTAKQRSVLTSQTVRSYLNSHCVKGPDGKTPEYRILDKDADLSREAIHWQNAIKLKTSTPWIVISNGKSGTSEKLPDSVDATMELLKRYGG